MPKADALLREDNADVRITEWRLAPGAATGYHRHDYDYVVVPLNDGTVKATGPSGDTVVSLQVGQAYFRKAGVEHDVVNVGTAPYAFTEVELKRQPG